MNNIRNRFIAAMSKPGAIIRLFDRQEHEAAFKPYWPEMLDFELPENSQAERDEITAYHATFAYDR